MKEEFGKTFLKLFYFRGYMLLLSSELQLFEKKIYIEKAF